MCAYGSRKNLISIELEPIMLIGMYMYNYVRTYVYQKNGTAATIYMYVVLKILKLNDEIVMAIFLRAN